MTLQTFARLRHRSLACEARDAHCFLAGLGFRVPDPTPTELG
jgi:hypothetical protein